MTNERIILILLSLTILMTVVMRIQNQPLITASAPVGIVSLEMSKTAEVTNQIRSEWTGSIRQAFYVNIALDYFYMLFYGLFIFFTCRYFAMLRPGNQKIGIYAATGGLTAAGLDAIENLLMVISISLGGTDMISTTTATVATIKFLLIGAAFLYIIFSVLMLLVKKLSGK